MDAIKKKMEKLSNETATAEARIAHFEDIKVAHLLNAAKCRNAAAVLLYFFLLDKFTFVWSF